MFEITEYYGGLVKCISFEVDGGQAVIGVMAPGEYEFTSSRTGYFTVTTGVIFLMLPSHLVWKPYKPYETIIIPPDIKFKLKCTANTSYKLIYQ
ncbi:MAG TPA: pyrimidine/purine nucleoside phosphorylase [Bacteroidales bacterium]|jgi:hypothetical protein|nr:DUF1255 family protein [Bacteroidales bacterium]MDI9574023.1 pyrimidine/purine nucleoside phosphorylase [Bacteroidota bacterium]OQC59750.1 MAG: hypothetical protein BWX51_01365 [Bacteroidetes bacterium ADurb.Bin012]MBP9512529.1 DUF1255 family protein [Bacteroidales bacterium]MBP9589045.1 DUF1255 family protein [Bacteroidales bacterium]